MILQLDGIKKNGWSTTGAKSLAKRPISSLFVPQPGHVVIIDLNKPDAVAPQ